MNIENISKYIAAIQTLFFYLAFTSLAALPFILVTLENPLSMFNIALAVFGLTFTFFVLLLTLNFIIDFFSLFAFYFLVCLIQSADLIKEIAKKTKNCKKTKGAA